MTDKLPRIEGSGVCIWNGVQAAIDQARQTYRRRFGLEATHVALPSNVARDGLKLGDLNLGCPSGPGVVIAGRPVTGDGPTSSLQRGSARTEP